LSYADGVRPHPPYPRIRKTVKWGGAVVTALLVVVWIGSAWVYVTYGSLSTPTFEIRGREFGYYDAGIRAGRSTLACGTNPYRPSRDWLPHWESWAGPFTSKGISLSVPLWSPAIACLILTLGIWQYVTLARRRVLRLNLCPKCNYDRTGLAAGAVCPECGAGALVSKG
jgi:hypothetical protein